MKSVVSFDSVNLPAGTYKLEAMLAEMVRDRGEEALADLALQMQLNVNSSRAAAFVKSQSQRALALIESAVNISCKSMLADS